MTPPRHDARRDYRSFPTAYGTLLHEFNAKGSASIGPMPEADARASLRDLYRFKMFLIADAAADPSDVFCRKLRDIATVAMMRVSPVAVEDPRGSYMVELSLNPVERAMRDRAAPLSEEQELSQDQINDLTRNL